MLGGGIIPARAGFTPGPRFRSRCAKDHPRSRGVYSNPGWVPEAGGGSSPLARGLLIVGSPRELDRRIIPARAGFTWRRRAACYCAADHPRSRGVYPGRLRPSSTRSGSSPLARGLLNNRHKKAIARRIIPARAGFTNCRGGAGDRPRDHPRSRGVYRSERSRSGSRGGSSPLARGLRAASHRLTTRTRIIPARAGFTHHRHRHRHRHRGRGGDHPRSRGVYRKYIVSVPGMVGSSPLARGLPLLPHLTGDGDGIIPARAGFTAEVLGPRTHQRDHPRSRGVYTHAHVSFVPPAGSSPLARGLLDLGQRLHHGPGIIPARAGFTPGSRPGRDGRQDHPRSRGVYGGAGRWGQAPVGSSPLARGLRKGLGSTPRGGGIIPARAGFTVAVFRPAAARLDHPRSRGVYR